MISKKYKVCTGDEVFFANKADYCIGTGRIGLALRAEYQRQLKLVQETIGFQYIRGHGLFSDDMAIYQTYEAEDGSICTEYNFTYLDMVMDFYQEIGIRPFLELGFMPEQLASGEQTIFYWKGNVTPPKQYHAWAELVQVTLQHLIDRYGRDEVITWPVEVWNEPNLEIFWENADMEEYFRLFEVTFQAVKAVDAGFRVGGPAICGVNDEVWMNAFLQFCERQEILLDFCTRHHYTISAPERIGHYTYAKLHNPDISLAELGATRTLIDSFQKFRGMELHITEFNTSYRPDGPVHDSNLNAAYTAYLLSRLGEGHESYSYWTFGDVFEELGVPFTPFHGGFGLVANGRIPKPTFWTFAFFKQLQGKCVHKSSDMIVMKTDQGYCGIAWNIQPDILTLSIQLETDKTGAYCIITKTVDEKTCNPLKLWHDMGEAATLNKKQTELLQAAAQPLINSLKAFPEEGLLVTELELQPYGLIYFEAFPICEVSDRGYSYQKAVRGGVEQ